MPRASARRRASAAGTWPGSSPSGRLLMITLIPAAASASMWSRDSAPAALTPGASSISGCKDGIGGSCSAQAKRAADSQPVAVPSPEKFARLCRVLTGPLHQVAGADPEPLEPPQGDDDGVEVLARHRRLRQHLHVAAVHRAEPVAQLASLFGQADMDRPAVVDRAFLGEIAVLDHLLDVVGHVRAEIAAAQRQFPDGHLGIADVEQHHALHVVDVVNAEPVELELDDLKEVTVKALDERNHLEIAVPVQHQNPRRDDLSGESLAPVLLNFRFHAAGAEPRTRRMMPEKSSPAFPASTKSW